MTSDPHHRHRTASPLLALALPLAILLGACGTTSYGPSPEATRAATADEAAEIDDFEVVARSAGDGDIERVELLAPPGARRHGDDPGEPPYIWRGAPLAVRVKLARDAERGSQGGTVLVLWFDEAGEEVAMADKQTVPRWPWPPNDVVRLEASPTEELGEGAYRVLVRYRPARPFGQVGINKPRPTSESSLAFAIGEPPMATVDPPPPAPAFPWPPPQPTTRHVLESDRLGTDGTAPETLGEAADQLLEALQSVGYSEHSFYSIQPEPERPPEGFALVTRLEQIDPDGTPRPGDARWSAQLPPREIFSLKDFVRALFTAPEGHYRVIVFTVTGLPVVPSDEEPTREQAGAWLGSGLAHLPNALADLPWSRDHVCTALIYQFRQVGAGNEPEVHPPGAPPARKQLERTGLTALTGGAVGAGGGG